MNGYILIYTYATPTNVLAPLSQAPNLVSLQDDLDLAETTARLVTAVADHEALLGEVREAKAHAESLAATLASRESEHGTSLNTKEAQYAQQLAAVVQQHREHLLRFFSSRATQRIVRQHWNMWVMLTRASALSSRTFEHDMALRRHQEEHEAALRGHEAAMREHEEETERDMIV